MDTHRCSEALDGHREALRLDRGPRPLEGQSTQTVIEIGGGQKPREVGLLRVADR